MQLTAISWSDRKTAALWLCRVTVIVKARCGFLMEQDKKKEKRKSQSAVVHLTKPSKRTETGAKTQTVTALHCA